MAKKEESELFVGIEGHKEMRKQLLGSAKIAINNLQGYEHVNTLRTEKIKYIFELRRLGEELAVLNRKLKQALPKTTAKIKHRGAKKVKEAKKQEEVAPPKAPEVESEKLAALEDELSKVEEKLSGL